jgi:hypothetical protein
MANTINIDENTKEIVEILQKAVQSANLNFLLGSGCTMPAIKTLGNIEKDIQNELENGNDEEAEKLTFEFLKPFLENTNTLIKDSFIEGCSTDECDTLETFNNYTYFIDAISQILFERKSNILHKQATIFTTNYDLFIERVFEKFPDQLILNDGFKRVPSVNNTFRFSAAEYFNVIYNTGNLYNYQVQIPTINLIKLHGSLNWQRKDKRIIHSLEYLKNAENLKKSTEIKNITEFNNLFSIILPKKDKFKETLLNQIYYDLLRIYANELDKENTLLIVEGFSFDDEHIFDITIRALKNPTLKLIIFCWEKEPNNYIEKFSSFNNVDIIYSEKDNIDFKYFAKFILEILPKKNENPIYKVEIKKPDEEK